MYTNLFDGILSLIAGLFIIALLGLGYVAYDIIFDSDEIVVDKPIQPELKLTIKNNRVDTLYVYKKP